MGESDSSVQHGVVAVIERDGRWLMIRRAEAVIAPGYWCFPGGGIEAGETAEQAVIREIREELGLDVLPQREIWCWQRPDGKLVLHWWRVALADEGQEPRPSPHEVAEACWLTVPEIRKLKPALESNGIFLEHYEREKKAISS